VHTRHDTDPSLITKFHAKPTRTAVATTPATRPRRKPGALDTPGVKASKTTSAPAPSTAIMGTCGFFLTRSQEIRRPLVVSSRPAAPITTAFEPNRRRHLDNRPARSLGSRPTSAPGTRRIVGHEIWNAHRLHGAACLA